MKKTHFIFTLCLCLLFLASCSQKEEIQATDAGPVAGPMFEVDLSQDEIDFTEDERFKDLSVDQILSILEANSEPLAFPRSCSNCVHYVRGKDSRLMPTSINCSGTTYWTNTGCFGGKRKLVNTCNPSVGAAMVEDRGTYAGHVAYVEQVVWVHSHYPLIRISEGNLPYGSCSSRWLDGFSSAVKGYQNPNYGNNCNNAPYWSCDPPYGC